MSGFLRGTRQRIIRYFLAGIFAVLPVVITVAVVVWVAEMMKGYIGPDTLIGSGLRKVGLNLVESDTLAYLIGWIIVLGVVFALGVLVELGAKRLFHRIADAFLSRVPIVKSIYSTSRQLIGMMDKKDDADLKGMRAVYCFFGKEHPTVLLALLTSPEQFAIEGRDYFAVIIPTAPVPVGGGLMFVPVESVVVADLSVDALMSIYVSMGVTAPQFLAAEK
ncbi:MAG: DUF502 domain-containing protein [Pirellulales bacterium]